MKSLIDQELSCNGWAQIADYQNVYRKNQYQNVLRDRIDSTNNESSFIVLNRIEMCGY